MREVYTASSQNLLLRFFATLFLTLLYIIFLLKSHWGLGFPLVNLALILTLLILYPDLRTKKESLFYMGTSLLLSLFLPLRSYELGRVLTILTVFLLNSLAIARVSASQQEPLTLKAIIFIPIAFLLRSVTEIASWVDTLCNTLGGKEERGGVTVAQGLRGALIALPLILLFSFLLVSADPLFERFFLNLIPNVSLNLELLRTRMERDYCSIKFAQKT